MTLAIGALTGVAVYLMLGKAVPLSKRLWFWLKVKLSHNRQTYVESRLADIRELLIAAEKPSEMESLILTAIHDHDTRAIQELVSIKAALSDASMPQLYIQSLSSLSKGINTLLERQEKQEQQFISLVSALNKLTSRSE